MNRILEILDIDLGLKQEKLEHAVGGYRVSLGVKDVLLVTGETDIRSLDIMSLKKFLKLPARVLKSNVDLL